MEELFIQEGNRKRKAEKFNCLHCNKEFIRRKNPPKGKWIYCSHKCSTVAAQKRITVVCTNCQKEFEKKNSQLRNSKSGLYFCSRKCKDFAQSLQGKCSQIRPDHYGTAEGMYSYRLLMKENILEGCIVCKEKMAFKLSVHHIDGDRTNNQPSNLEVLCFNCHTVRHIVKNRKNKWVLNFKQLTDREIVKTFDAEKMNK